MYEGIKRKEQTNVLDLAQKLSLIHFIDQTNNINKQ